MQGKKKTTVINIYGGPGAGKTGLLHLLMGYCKVNNVDAEAASEYAKEPVVRGIKLNPTDQIYLLAKQHKKESTFYGKTDFIITDCPLWMSIAYEKELTQPPFVSRNIIQKYLSHSPDVERKHILLKRPDTYNPSGRRQNESQAKEFDQKYLFPFLKEEFGDNLLTFTTGEYELTDIIKALEIK